MLGAKCNNFADELQPLVAVEVEVECDVDVVAVANDAAAAVAVVAVHIVGSILVPTT